MRLLAWILMGGSFFFLLAALFFFRLRTAADMPFFLGRIEPRWAGTFSLTAGVCVYFIGRLLNFLVGMLWPK